MLAQELENIFRRNLRLRREELGLTQTDLAELVGVPQSHICALERGRMAPTLKTIARLATALRCPPSWLLDAQQMALVEDSRDGARMPSANDG